MIILFIIVNFIVLSQSKYYGKDCNVPYCIECDEPGVCTNCSEGYFPENEDKDKNDENYGKCLPICNYNSEKCDTTMCPENTYPDDDSCIVKPHINCYNSTAERDEDKCCEGTTKIYEQCEYHPELQEEDSECAIAAFEGNILKCRKCRYGKLNNETGKCESIKYMEKNECMSGYYKKDNECIKGIIPNCMRYNVSENNIVTCSECLIGYELNETDNGNNGKIQTCKQIPLEQRLKQKLRRSNKLKSKRQLKGFFSFSDILNLFKKHGCSESEIPSYDSEYDQEDCVDANEFGDVGCGYIQDGHCKQCKNNYFNNTVTNKCDECHCYECGKIPNKSPYCEGICVDNQDGTAKISVSNTCKKPNQRSFKREGEQEEQREDCASCNPGYYLTENYTCELCEDECHGRCIGSASNCLFEANIPHCEKFDGEGGCSQCEDDYYWNTKEKKCLARPYICYEYQPNKTKCNICYKSDTKEYYFTDPEIGDCGDINVLPSNPSNVSCPNHHYNRTEDNKCIFKCDPTKETRSVANNRCECKDKNMDVDATGHCNLRCRKEDSNVKKGRYKKDASGECECIPGLVMNVGSKKGQKTACVKNCAQIQNDTNSVYDDENDRCICRKGHKNNTTTNQCSDCETGYEKDTNGRCIYKCNATEQLEANEDNDGCVCKRFYKMNKENKCELYCEPRDNYEENKDKNGCVCKKYFIQNPKQQECELVCELTNHLIPNEKLDGCECEKGYEWKDENRMMCIEKPKDNVPTSSGGPSNGSSTLFISMILSVVLMILL